MLIRIAFVASLLGIVGYTSAASANSCSNLNVIGSFDESGIRENEYWINAAGTFRIAGEQDESKQPMFNLTVISCEKQSGVSLVCKVMKATVYAQSGNPDPNNPNCSLDLSSSEYSMRELQRGVLAGMEAESSACYNSILTIDQNTNRVYMSFTRTKGADNFDRIRPGTCGVSPRQQVLMNCTGYPRMRKQGGTPPRYCDFSSSSDK
jgi:hypothetical protein